MSGMDKTEVKKGKFVLLSFENKHTSDYEGLRRLFSEFASFGYYFDKISRVAFDNSEEIVRALKDSIAYYDNVVLYFPAGMDKTLKSFISNLVNSEFDALGVLTSGSLNVFAFYSDSGNRLTFDDVKSVLSKKYGTSFGSTVIRTVCAPKHEFIGAIENAKKILKSSVAGDDAHVNVEESYGDCRIEIVYSEKTPKMVIDGAVREILKRLNDYVYAVGDIPLTDQLFRLLQLRRMKISVAESFTGGGISSRLVKVSGISEVFFEGLNTYSNQSKVQRLGVKESTLQQYGAVSAETAREMAEGLLITGNCDVAVATTGIAGPKSDNTQKPVGLAYIAVGSLNRGVLVYEFNFAGDREEITQTAINQALFLAYKELK